MKTDNAYMRELMRTFQHLDDLLTSSQRDEIYRSSLVALETLSKSLDSYEMRSVSASSSIAKALDEFSHQQASLLDSFQLDEQFSRSILLQAMKDQLNVLCIIDQSATTPMLEALRSATLRFDHKLYLDTLSKTMAQPIIEAADIGFLKVANIKQTLSGVLALPYGLSTVLDKLNMGTAKTIAQEEDISYNVAKKTFFDEHNPSATAVPKEINVICSASQFFEEIDDRDSELISATELMNFMTILSDRPGFAGNTSIGQRILEIIRNVVTRIGFDLDLYYHARGRNPEEAPYTADRMLTAPAGMTGPGRYNHPGQAFYYFASSADGAKAEIKKHEPNKTIQVARIRPIRPICMIDLSGTLTRGSMFLKYIRFNASNERMPREYLIPCFVSDCCRVCNIDGIKYYGSKEYNNYVAWNPSYFQFVEMVEG